MHSCEKCDAGDCCERTDLKNEPVLCDKCYAEELKNIQENLRFNRGMLTNKIQESCRLFLGRDITQKKLRLYPYIDYSIKNMCQGWSYDKLSKEELDILCNLYNERHLIYSPEKITVTREFYNFMQDILAQSYVGYFLPNNI